MIKDAISVRVPKGDFFVDKNILPLASAFIGL